VALVTVGISTRYLGLTTYGQFATVTIYMSLFMVLTDAGFSNIAVRELSKKPGRTREILSSILMLRASMGLLLSVISVLVAFLIYRGGGEANIRLGVTILSSTLFLNAVQTTLSSIISARIENYLLVVGDVANKVVTLVGVIWTVANNYGFYGIATSYLAGAVVWFISDSWFSLRRARPGLGADRRYIVNLVKSSLPYSAAIIINTLYFRADGFLLSVMKGPAEVGLYSLGYKMVELTMAFPVFFALAILPVLAAAKDKHRLSTIVQDSARMMSILGTALAIGTIVLAPQIVLLLGGPEFKAAALPLAILMVGNYFIYQSTVYMQSLLATENQSWILRVNLALLLVNVIVNLILIPPLGTVGAATAVVIAEAMALGILRWYFVRHLGTPLSWGKALAPLLPGAVMAMAVWWGKDWLIKIGLHNIEVIIGSVVIGAVIFTLGILATKQITPAEVRTMLKRGEATS
jgi:O-antigen/teichoic acid export membrane protein